jgi:drug/metabolite transporter (DMT)-like permease
MSENRRAILLMLVFVGLWAAIEIMAWQVLQRYSPYQVVWTRYAVHLLLMVLVFGWREPAALVRTRRPVFHLVRSLLMLGMPASWVMGMQAGLTGEAVMSVFWISPLLVVVLGFLFLRDRAPVAIWVATLVAGLGTLLVHPPHALPSLRLLAYPLGMALSFSAYVVMTRSLRDERTRANLFYTALGVFLALSPFMPGLWIWPAPADLAVMVAVGVLGCLTLYALDRATAAAPVSLSAPFIYMQVALTLFLLIGLGVLGAGKLPLHVGMGLLLIVGAAVFVWVRESRLKPQDALSAAAPH